MKWTIRDSWYNADIELQVEFDRNSSPLLDLPLVTSESAVGECLDLPKNEAFGGSLATWAIDRHVIIHLPDVTRPVVNEFAIVLLNSRKGSGSLYIFNQSATTVYEGVLELWETGKEWACHRGGTRYIVLFVCGEWVYP